MTDILLLSLRPIGWAMIHSLWQGTVLLALIVPLMLILRKKSASLRYTILYAALLALVVFPVLTAEWQLPDGSAVPAAPAAASSEISPALESRAAVTETSAAAPDDLFDHAAATLEPALPWIAALWFLGFLTSFARLTVDWIRLRRLVHRAELCTNTLWITTVTRLKERLQLRRLITLLESSDIDVPTVAGWLRPVILVPVSTLTGLTPRQLETILAHEMAHIHRNDFIMNLVQSIAETLLFFHPAAWWLSKKIREERENCCDDIAVQLCGDAMLHARALTELETLRALRLTPAMAANGGSLLSRIRRLVAAPPDDSAPSLLGVGALAIVLILTVTLAPRLDGAATMPQFDLAAIAEGWSDASGTPVTEKVDVVASRRGGRDDSRSKATNQKVTPAPDHDDDDDADDDAPIDLNNLSVDELVSMKVHGITPEFFAKWEKLGYDDLSIDEASSLAALRITGDFAKEMSAEFGERLSIDELTGLKAVGVTPEFIRSMRSFAGRGVSVDDVTGARAVGVTPEYARKLAAAGFATADLEELTGARAVGVTPELIESLRANDLRVSSLEDVTSLRAVGVTPDYIAGIRASGIQVVDAEEIVSLRAIGVTPEYIRGIRAAGLDPDAEELSSLRALGVTPAYVQELRQEGVADLDAEELSSLKALGVSGEWIRSLKAAGYTNLDVDELTRMRSSGIDSEWLERIQKRTRRPRQK